MKREHESIIKKIALAPVRLAWGALKVIIVLALAIMITLAVVCFSRASQGMNMPAAGGMTYNAFLDDREKAMDPNGDFTFVEKSEYLTWPVIRSFMVSYPVTFSALYPDSKIATWSQINIKFYYTKTPKEEKPEWNNLPNLFWNAFEHASWTNLVNQNPEYRQPITPITPISPEPTAPPSLLDENTVSS